MKEAKTALLALVHQVPYEVGYPASRWTIGDLRAACPWLNVSSESGMGRLLQRLGIVKKRGRIGLHSPDPDYQAKLAYLTQCWDETLADPVHVHFLYLDEFSYYRQPTVAPAYQQRGNHQWRANLSHRSNTRCRGLGALNARTGQVHYCQTDKITLAVQKAFYQTLAQAYPDAHTIYVAQDNWPNHAHPDILACLQTQRSRLFPPTFNWSSLANRLPPDSALRIQLIFLPTYAPWTNPIEKLWRWLRQTVLHLHRFSDRWPDLKHRVLDFMAQFEHGSPQLLRYVGLLPV